MGNLGLGVMINMLGGDEETANTVKGVLGKKVASLRLDDNIIYLSTVDGIHIKIWDGGQECCEHRYVTTDDDLKYFTNTTLVDIELAKAPSPAHEYCDYHEVQFLRLKTKKGIATFETHNEHNGYYGGFSILAAPITP